jgi:hypothetical protein
LSLLLPLLLSLLLPLLLPLAFCRIAGFGSPTAWAALEHMSVVQQPIEHGGDGGAIANSLPQSSTGRFNAESTFMRTPQSMNANRCHLTVFLLRIIGAAFKEALRRALIS